MTNDSSDRKQSHLSICINEDVSFKKKKTLFDEIELVATALPGLSLVDIDTKTTFIGKELNAPLMIGAMTGGAGGERGNINSAFAKAAQKAGIALCLGSIRPALETSGLLKDFTVRNDAPDILLFSNIGANQLKEFGAKKIIEVSKKIEADGIMVHLNPSMELIQPGGATDFSHILEEISKLLHAALDYPVLVKETGMGLSYTDGMKLKNIGVKYVETGGAGGTSWVGVETLRSEGVDRAIGNMLWDFGIPTAVSTAWMVDAGLNVISSGGIRDSVDIARAISLGANMTAMARPLLKAFASDFENGLDNKLEELITGLKYVMMCTGCKTIEDLKSVSTVRGSKLSHYIETGWTS